MIGREGKRGGGGGGWILLRVTWNLHRYKHKRQSWCRPKTGDDKVRIIITKKKKKKKTPVTVAPTDPASVTPSKAMTVNVRPG